MPSIRHASKGRLSKMARNTDCDVTSCESRLGTPGIERISSHYLEQEIIGAFHFLQIYILVDIIFVPN
jgi:hypothetical protein